MESMRQIALGRQWQLGGLDVREDAVRTRRSAPIEPALKAWIDNVIVPALVDRWESREAAKAA